VGTLPGSPQKTVAVTRRGFLGAVSAGGAALTVASEGRAAAARPKTIGPRRAPVVLNVNGRDRKLAIEPRVTLLRALRNELDITGAKEICDRGSCGGCSVLVDGRLMNSCMMLALDAVGKKITTVEGLSKGEGKALVLDPLQKAFVEHDALQCGFCTPGMVMACKAILDANPSPTLVQIKRGLSGNLCRCGTYPRIFAAVQTAAKAIKAGA